jgi:hypothetical protein
MDIMNNMTVSTSKLTFSLIAVATLLIAGSAFTNQEAFAAVTFTASHNTTTQTDVTFNAFVNGTLNPADWRITLDGTSVGPFTDLIAISDVLNSTYKTPGYFLGNTNFLNHSTTIHLIHAAIPSDVTYNVNYTGAENVSGVGHVSTVDGLGFLADVTRGVIGSNEVFMVAGYDATADDRMIPTVVSAKVLTSNPSRVQVTFSETMAMVNGTFSAFTMTTLGGGNAAVPSSMNGQILQNATTFLYVDLQNPAKWNDVLTIAYDTAEGGLIGNHWFTDGTNSLTYGGSASATPGSNGGGVGNRLANFTAIAVTNDIQYGAYGDVTTCYDCSPPTVTKVQVSLDSSIPITVTDANKVHINAGIDDTVSVMVTVADNLGGDSIPFAGLYTNFGQTPDNLFYSNNFDSTKQMSTSYYEWNVRTNDIAFDNNGAIAWTDATAKVNSDRTQTFTYTMTINDAIESTQVWVDIGDKTGNYAKVSLPIILEVSGAPGLTFASDDTQKVVSFFNESILLAIVSQWTATSSNDASNVEQLSSVLGIESQLPTWTTDLASWVADDKIDVADMIVAVEYVINL